MKALAFLFLASLFSSSLVAQDAKTVKTQSQTDEFSAQTGTLFQKEFVDVGKIKGLKVQVQRTTDLLTKKSLNGIRFEYEYQASYGSDTKISVIDKDEVAALESSLVMIKSTIMPSTMANYTEVAFTSRSGFQAGCYNEAGKPDWTPFVKVEKFDSKSYVFMKAEDLDQLIALIQSAKAQL